MRIRVACPGVPNGQIGTATWPFPTAGLVSYDPVGGTAIFDIPDTDMPAGIAQPGTAAFPNTPVGAVLIGPGAANVGAWWTALQQKYPSLVGKAPPVIQ